MKTLTKLALISAMAMSSSAFAMESLDDSALSATTGQDGITIKLDAQADGTIFGADNLIIHDKDGIAGAGTAGAIVLGKQGSAGTGFSVKGAAGDAVNVVVDADANGGKPVLNISVGLPAALTISTGDIYVAESGGIAAASGAQYTQATAAKILDSVDVVLSGATLNIQLGNATDAQGAMIVLGGSIAGGLQINNLSLYQPTTTVLVAGSTPGASGIHLGGINISNKGDATKWDLTGKINATDAGLQVSGLGSVDVRLTDVGLGLKANAKLGDVALLGMALPNVTISGH